MARKKIFKWKLKNFISKAKNWANDNLSKDKVLGYQQNYNEMIDKANSTIAGAPKIQLYNKSVERKGIIFAVISGVILLLIVFRKRIF